MADPANITPAGTGTITARGPGDPPPLPDTPANEGTLKGALKRLAIPFLALAAALIGVAIATLDWNQWTADASRQSTDDANVSADVSAMGARVSGNIVNIAAIDYQTVKAGDLLAEIDPRPFEAAVGLAQANLDGAKASLANLANQQGLQRAAIDVATAQNDAAKAAVVQAEEEYHRQESLGGATSVQLLQQARATYLQDQAAVVSTQAAIEQQRAQLKVLDGQLPLLQSQVDAAAANLETAKLQLSYTRIEAPFDGVLSRFQIRVGDFVSPGSTIVSVVPLPRVYVTANFKETQLSRMAAGTAAVISVDTFPGQPLRGHVARLSPASGAIFALLPPDNATGNFTKVVQRIPVRIELEPDQPLIDLLRPGMSAEVTVNVGGNGP